VVVSIGVARLSNPWSLLRAKYVPVLARTVRQYLVEACADTVMLTLSFQ
jgi:hypothetical protein